MQWAPSTPSSVLSALSKRVCSSAGDSSLSGRSAGRGGERRGMSADHRIGARLCSMKGERIALTGDVLPSSEVAQQVRRARESDLCQVIELQQLEPSEESAAFLHFAHHEQSPGRGREPRVLDVSQFGIVGAGREHVDAPASGDLVEHPQLEPAFQRLHGQHYRRAQRKRLCGSEPRDAIGAASRECRPVRLASVFERDARLPSLSGGGAQNERAFLGDRGLGAPADRADASDGIDVFRLPILTEIVLIRGD